MALSQSAASDLLDAFRAGDGVDLIRDKPMCSPWRIAAVRQAVRTGQARQSAFCGAALCPLLAGTRSPYPAGHGSVDVIGHRR